MRERTKKWVGGGAGIAMIATAAWLTQASVTIARASQGQAPAQGAGAQGRGGRGGVATPAPGQSGAGALGAGPIDWPAVDAESATRGRPVYAAQCINCHGTQARGTDNGPNLVRSEVVLSDRFGSMLGPFLAKGHPLQSGAASSSLTDAQVKDLMNFLRQRINDGLRGSPIFVAGNVLTGDVKAGEAFFSGPGQCTQCHSTTGNLAGIGMRLDPVNLQQRVIFPMVGRGSRGRGAGAPAPVTTVSVTPGTGAAMSGTLVFMDDFVVTLRDANNVMRTVRRTPDVKVVKTNPFQFHIDLLDRITDKQMHDVVAYLETLK
jgi:cytochrome c oxidase cbb3-type subunit 3